MTVAWINFYAMLFGGAQGLKERMPLYKNATERWGTRFQVRVRATRVPLQSPGAYGLDLKKKKKKVWVCGVVSVLFGVFAERSL
jgi:hypothetical protein